MKLMKGIVVKNKLIDGLDISNAEQVLIDNGIDPEEANNVLQALGYALLDVELYPSDK